MLFVTILLALTLIQAFEGPIYILNNLTQYEIEIDTLLIVPKHDMPAFPEGGNLTCEEISHALAMSISLTYRFVS